MRVKNTLGRILLEYADEETYGKEKSQAMLNMVVGVLHADLDQDLADDLIDKLFGDDIRGCVEEFLKGDDEKCSA